MGASSPSAKLSTFLIVAALANWCASPAFTGGSEPSRSGSDSDKHSSGKHSSINPVMTSSKPSVYDEVKINQAYGKLPLSFEANGDQTAPTVKYFARTPLFSVLLTQGGAVIALHNVQGSDLGQVTLGRSGSVSESTDSLSQIRNNQSTTLRLRLVNASTSSSIQALDELQTKYSYIKGSNQSKWRTGVAAYSKVKYEGVYPGIDMLYYGNRNQLEYDFYLAPGADPGAIRIAHEGARSIRIDAAGDLLLNTSAGAIRQHRPVAYQKIGGVIEEVKCEYAVRDNQVGFNLGAYDKDSLLIIDPVLSYAAFFGSTKGYDNIKSIAVDEAGNAYVTGSTFSDDFPTTPGVIQPAKKDQVDIFVAKLNSTGTAVIYSTYLGGQNFEEPSSIAVDKAGNAYVTGYTSSQDFPTTQKSFQAAYRGGYSDAVVTKLNPSGTALVYSAYLGGSDGDSGSAIALDAAGNAYVTGSTASHNLPTTEGAFQTRNKSSSIYSTDAFVAKLNSDGSSLIYSTYLGGSITDEGRHITVDAAGNAYVFGYTSSNNFPTTRNAFQTEMGAYASMFVSKLNGAGERLMYSTFLGDSYGLQTGGIAVDREGNAYLTGSTYTDDFPITPGAFQTVQRGALDVFVTKLNARGTALIYSTYLGGSDSETSGGIAVDPLGNAYVTGSTYSFDFPLANPLQSRKVGGPLFKSTDGGASWNDFPVGASHFGFIAIDPNMPSTLYASTERGVVKSTDKGDTWSETGLKVPGRLYFAHTTPTALYMLTALRVNKSTDGGATWSASDITKNVDVYEFDYATDLAIDPRNPSTLYATTTQAPIVVPDSPSSSFGPFDDLPARRSVFKSVDGGNTWSPLKIENDAHPFGNAIAIDPATPSTLYLGIRDEVRKSTDGGDTWSLLARSLFVRNFAIDPTNTSTIYASTNQQIYKTTDGGNTWRPILATVFAGPPLILDPQAPSTLYAISTVGNTVKSTDGGESWSTILGGLAGYLAIDPHDSSALYIGSSSHTDIFMTKLNPAGNAIAYSTYAGGFGYEAGKAIAADPYGNVYVVAESTSYNLAALPSALQRGNSGGFAGLVIKISDPAALRIASVSIKGKDLLVTGEGFDKGATILINGEAQETRNDDVAPSAILISPKAGKKIGRGQSVNIQVRNSVGTTSEAVSFRRPA